jgi:hypothetical protein
LLDSENIEFYILPFDDNDDNKIRWYFRCVP